MSVNDSVTSAEHMVSVLNEKMIMKDCGMNEPEALMYLRACELLNTWFTYNEKILSRYAQQLDKDLGGATDVE